ncbi:hypothetical protein, partial [Phenylobacterium sp.]|uniref:hypothetical protein n=1 Tax=Phenylobacterium sp. TaxID=1871053 RepID=UPI0025F3A692
WRPQVRKAPGRRAIFQAPSKPRRQGQGAKAVSERNLSLITRTLPSAVRVQKGPHLQRFRLLNGAAIWVLTPLMAPVMAAISDSEPAPSHPDPAGDQARTGRRPR